MANQQRSFANNVYDRFGLFCVLKIPKIDAEMSITFNNIDMFWLKCITKENLANIHQFTQLSLP